MIYFKIPSEKQKEKSTQPISYEKVLQHIKWNVQRTKETKSCGKIQCYFLFEEQEKNLKREGR